jgi:hypothetical protein
MIYKLLVFFDHLSMDHQLTNLNYVFAYVDFIRCNMGKHEDECNTHVSDVQIDDKKLCSALSFLAATEETRSFLESLNDLLIMMIWNDFEILSSSIGI